MEYIRPARAGHAEKWKGSCIDMACRAHERKRSALQRGGCGI